MATVILAGFTYWLARETRSLAIETADDLKAGWRPVLVPATQRLKLNLSSANELCEVVIPIVNGGRGPALNIDGVCYSASSLQTLCTETLNLGTLSPGETRALEAPEMLSRDLARSDQSWLHYYGVLSYEDLAGKRYWSRFIYVAWSPEEIEQRRVGNEPYDLAITSMETWEAPDEENQFVTPPGAWDIRHDPNKEPGQKPEPDWRQRLRA